MKLSARISHRGLHGHEHIASDRREAVWMIRTGMARVYTWLALLACFLIGLVFAPLHPFVKLFALVAFTASISTISLIETAWSQVAASKAQLAAADAHQDAEHNRKALYTGTRDIEEDIARLAQLQPCREADELAERIRAQIAGA